LRREKGCADAHANLLAGTTDSPRVIPQVDVGEGLARAVREASAR